MAKRPNLPAAAPAAVAPAAPAADPPSVAPALAPAAAPPRPSSMSVMEKPPSSFPPNKPLNIPGFFGNLSRISLNTSPSPAIPAAATTSEGGSFVKKLFVRVPNPLSLPKILDINP